MTFTGHLDDDALVEAMQGCRATLFPSRDDFGLVPVEVMACGRPVVAFAGGGARHTVVPGLSGTLVRAQTADAFARAVRRFRDDLVPVCSAPRAALGRAGVPAAAGGSGPAGVAGRASHGTGTVAENPNVLSGQVPESPSRPTVAEAANPHAGRSGILRRMPCLVTGGAGFLGAHVARALLDAGHEVVVLDDLSGGFADNVARARGW